MTETATEFKAPKKTRAALYGFLILALFAGASQLNDSSTKM